MKFDDHKNQIEQAIKQDQNAWNELFHTYYPLAMKKALMLTHNQADAEDVVQEAFLQIYHSISSLHDTSSFIPWLYKIIHSKCINLFHKNQYHYAVDPFSLERYSDYQEQRNYMLPKQAMEIQTRKNILYHSIVALKPAERDIIILTFLFEQKLEETAQQLQIPLGTVKTRRHKAKMHLRQHIISKEIQSFYQ